MDDNGDVGIMAKPAVFDAISCTTNTSCVSVDDLGKNGTCGCEVTNIGFRGELDALGGKRLSHATISG